MPFAYLIYLELIAISIIDVIISITIQRRIANAEKTYHLQAKMNKHMKDLKELSDNKASAEVLAAKQKEIQQTMSDSMMHQLRATPVLFVISLLLYFFILPNLFPIPIIMVSPTNPGAGQPVTITAQAPPGTQNLVGIWMSGGMYGSGNLLSQNSITDVLTAPYAPGNYVAEAYDLNTSVYTSGINIDVSSSTANASSLTNATTQPEYNLIVYKLKYHTFDNSIFFILITIVLSFGIQLLLGRRDKARYEAKVKSGEIKL